MWLIDTETLALQHFVFEKAPRYAILSHTWGDQEVSLAEFQHLDDATKAKAGFSKIEKTCWLAKQEGIRYAWVDTCCIDKSSSAELSESINSMFAYYHNSTICYAYIFDWPTDTREAAIISNRDLSQCRWFTRGWTLQELIAPREVRFYDATWTPRGHKSDPSLVFRLSILTGIPIEVLQTGGGVSLSGIPVAQRMSWASGRETTRTEDMAYCLLGIFQINIPLLYGEGQGAFRRLQEEIIRSSTDLSIFAWKEPSSGWPGIRPFRPSVSRIFANHPRLFTDLGRCSLLKSPLFSPPEITATNRGLRFHGRFFELPKSDPMSGTTLFLNTGCILEPKPGERIIESSIFVEFKLHSNDLYIRGSLVRRAIGPPWALDRALAASLVRGPSRTIYVLPETFSAVSSFATESPERVLAIKYNRWKYYKSEQYSVEFVSAWPPGSNISTPDAQTLWIRHNNASRVVGYLTMALRCKGNSDYDVRFLLIYFKRPTGVMKEVSIRLLEGENATRFVEFATVLEDLEPLVAEEALIREVELLAVAENATLLPTLEAPDVTLKQKIRVEVFSRRDVTEKQTISLRIGGELI